MPVFSCMVGHLSDSGKPSAWRDIASQHRCFSPVDARLFGYRQSTGAPLATARFFSDNDARRREAENNEKM
ncbi:hypothetical protein [Microvirgula aerodenitrificans]|uniref:hypothetical protein n=1 Tax=Microvirgula aerodenitrificans TaxID=57480 RepID=UPI00248E11BA|nr:hypothetical protein [Microvirgula aerodenitrificans]